MLPNQDFYQDYTWFVNDKLAKGCALKVSEIIRLKLATTKSPGPG